MCSRNIDCPINYNIENKHPSETTPRVNCRNYLKNYCNEAKKPICIRPLDEKMFINLNNKGKIEVSRFTNNQKIEHREFIFNKLPPLLKPVSNNIDPFIINNT